MTRNGLCVVNYHVPCMTLKDALSMAYDVYLADGLKPSSIDLGDDKTWVPFVERDALQVKLGDMKPEEYISLHRNAG